MFEIKFKYADKMRTVEVRIRYKIYFVTFVDTADLDIVFYDIPHINA